MMKKAWLFVAGACLFAVLAGCGVPVSTGMDTQHPSVSSSAEGTAPAEPPSQKEGSIPSESSASTPSNPEIKTGLIGEQILEGETGEIHYSYILPEGYDGSRSYPMMVVMPGYDMMWFGEDSSGSNLSWNGFRVWGEQEEKMIVVSAQLTDWGGDLRPAGDRTDRVFPPKLRCRPGKGLRRWIFGGRRDHVAGSIDAP